ncbi:hypothetical protein F4804DRAFT_98341 [Jackrogersella minutella]|nr:hypothetical protein F4804DRAFT_98341 [Jackrogersella minutella]
MPPPEPLRGLAARAADVLSAPAIRDPSPSPLLPTKLTQKLHALASRTILRPRLATDVSTVPEGYGRTPSGPEPGAVVGIVLGSIAGFVLLLGLIYWCVNLGGPAAADIEEGSVGAGGSSSVVSYRSRPRAHRHRHRSHSPRRRTKETIEISRRDVRRSVSPPRTPGPDQIVVVEEHDRSSRSRSRSRSMSRPRPPPVDDEIVVLEEHTPPRRRESRSYRRRSTERRSGHYRDVDPYRFAGGDAPSRDISRRRSSSRR